MLDKLDSFHSLAIIEIQILISIYHIFYRWLDTSDYVAKLLEKDKFFYNNIENMSNPRYHYTSFYVCGLPNYIKIQEQFLILIIINVIVIVFYKEIQTSRLFFNAAILDFFSPFCPKMLAFLFAIIH